MTLFVFILLNTPWHGVCFPLHCVCFQSWTGTLDYKRLRHRITRDAGPHFCGPVGVFSGKAKAYRTVDDASFASGTYALKSEQASVLVAIGK